MPATNWSNTGYCTYNPCPEYYLDIGKNCTPCDESCKKCNATLNFEKCKVCATVNHYLLVDSELLDTPYRYGKCVTVCDTSNYFFSFNNEDDPNLQGKICSNCDVTCKTCVNQHAASCTSCRSEDHVV